MYFAQLRKLMFEVQLIFLSYQKSYDPFNNGNKSCLLKGEVNARCLSLQKLHSAAAQPAGTRIG